MHLWQAIKMACKSLWSNKLRSFLTMLGIIIGVTTVALLTSVASGVSTAIVSSIRSQSTLSIIMGATDKMTYGTVSNVLKQNQHEETADDYYNYALIYNTNRVIAQDLTGMTQEAFNSDYTSLLNFNKVELTEEQKSQMTQAEITLIQMLLMQTKKTAPTSASVYAVDKNFTDVYDMKYEGTFPTKSDELLVDNDFIDAYLPGVERQNVVGSTVSIGVEYYTQIKLSFSRELSAEEVANVIAYLKGEYEVTSGTETTSVGLKLELKKDKTTEAEIFEYDALTSTLVVDLKFTTNATNEELVAKASGTYTASSPFEQYVAPFYQSLLVDDGVEAQDIYDISNQKVYTITGIIDEENASFMSSMSSSGSSDKLSIVDVMMASRKGSCYTVLDDGAGTSNLASLGLENHSSKANVPISFAYLRFKTEDVMEDRINDLSVAFISSGIIYMRDFMIISMNAVASIVGEVMSILTTMLTVISVVSLIVGGIGIMNIMLVAVTERTREIGVRKAIGAKRSSILTQFLVEALMLSLIGGAIGLGISAIGCWIIGNLMGVTIVMPFWVIAMSLGFCTAIGLIFGMFPAIKAARMQPIDALRRE